MEINISSLLVKIFLRFNPFNRIKVMCLGYNEDFKNFTELVWRDDKELDFFDKELYPKFQLWFV